MNGAHIHYSTPKSKLRFPHQILPLNNKNTASSNKNKQDNDSIHFSEIEAVI